MGKQAKASLTFKVYVCTSFQNVHNYTRHKVTKVYLSILISVL